MPRLYCTRMYILATYGIRYVHGTAALCMCITYVFVEHTSSVNSCVFRSPDCISDIGKMSFVSSALRFRET